MKKFWVIFWVVILVAALVGTMGFLWSKMRPVKTVYEIIEPVRDTINQYVIATGKVEPRDEVLIKPQISGIVSALMKEPGQPVREGEIIATVKVIPEMSSLNNAESRVSQAQISLEQSEREYGRAKTLFDSDVISREEFEKIETSLMMAREDLQSAKDNLEIVRDGITSRNAEISNTQIRSTITGMILDIPIKVGNSVIQSNTFNDGTTIASVADMGDMIFRGNVDETDVGKLKEGMGVELTIGALQNVELDAELEYISPKAAEENNVIVFEVKAAVRNRDDLFVRAGYSANASVKIESREDILTIPESAVLFEEGKPCVYVLTSAEGAEEQTFEKRDVVLGLSDGLKIEIVEGLTVQDGVRGAVKAKEQKKSEVENNMRRRP